MCPLLSIFSMCLFFLHLIKLYKVAYIFRVSAAKKLRPYKTISSFIAPLFVRH